MKKTFDTLRRIWGLFLSSFELILEIIEDNKWYSAFSEKTREIFLIGDIGGWISSYIFSKISKSM